MTYTTPVVTILGPAAEFVRGEEKNDPSIADGHPIYHSTSAAYEVDE
jgi:hypothetical protein